MKIVSVLKLPEKIMTICQDMGEITIKKRSTLTIEDICDVDILIGNISPQLLEKCTHLKYYQLDSAGSEQYAKVVSKSCILCNASGTFGPTISEHLIMTTLMLFRNMPDYIEQQKNHVYQQQRHVKMIKNSRFMIIGTGDLGYQYAHSVKSLGGYTIGIKRTFDNVRKLDIFDEVYTNEAIDELLPQIDVVCLCLPRNVMSDHLMDARRLSLLQNDAIVLNVGRGNALEQKHLCKMLNEGKLLGAALDVFEKEPIEADDPIWDTKNLIITPHVSGTYANEWTYSLFYDILEENLNCFFAHKPMRNVVNRKMGY